jgi:hypothetical protein
MWQVNRWQTTEDGCHVMIKAHIVFRTLCFNIISHYVSPADSMFFTSMSSNSYIPLTSVTLGHISLDCKANVEQFNHQCVERSAKWIYELLDIEVKNIESAGDK